MLGVLLFSPNLDDNKIWFLIAKVNHFLMGDIWMYGWMSRKWLKLDQWFDISELDDNSYVLTLYVGYIRIDG